MITPQEFASRRDRLAESLDDDGVVLLLGNDHAAMSYAANPYPFRQEPSFRYFFGLNEPGAAGWLDLATGEQRVYGHEPDLDSIIWEGDLPGLAERAQAFGQLEALPSSRLADDLRRLAPGRRVHALPPVRATSRDRLISLIGHAEPSPDLLRAVVALREVKTASELEEIAEAVDRAATLHTLAMRVSCPGIHEYEVVSQLQAAAAANGWEWSYPVIFSVRGEVLHNPSHDNLMVAGQLVVNDSGVSSPNGYASDITRSFPVSGRFTPEQRAVYEVVLAAQAAAIDVALPGSPYRVAHDAAGQAITEGLTAMGIMRGDVGESVAAGAFAAFMPHGVGHMLGLDVHDMEGLGEDNVGYDAAHGRAEEFGLRNLRLGKPLQPGFVMTVEPGVYFIPALLDRWHRAGTNGEFIDFDAALRFADFGGIRIEDVVTVTETGSVLVGEPIAKSIAEVEAYCAA